MNAIATTRLWLACAAIAFCAWVTTGRAESLALDETLRTNTIKIVCIGDSITSGLGLAEPTRQSYPARLATMLGPKWATLNVGIPAVTCLASGDKPLCNQPAIPTAMGMDPDVVVIMLGTNDATTNNWLHADKFVSDYVDLVNAFKGMWTHPQVWICTPPPTFTPPGSIVEDAVITDQLIPKIHEVAAKTGVSVIDIHAIMKDMEGFFPDKIHPNAEGALNIAEHVYRAITGRVPPRRE